MLTKRARSTVTPYALFAAKFRNWVPPHGLTLKSYNVRGGFLGYTFEVVLTCQCEAEELLTLRCMLSRDYWDDCAIHRDVIIEAILDNLYEAAKQETAQHAGARA